MEQIAQVSDVSSHLELLRESVRDSEVAGEGYAVSRQTLFLDLYMNASQRVESEIRVLRDVPEAWYWDPMQFQVLTEDILERQTQWQKRVEDIRQNGEPEAPKQIHALDAAGERHAHEDRLRSFHRDVQSNLRSLRTSARAESGYLGWASTAVVLAGLASTVVCWWLIRNDVSRSRQVQRRLEESQARFSGILEISEDAIVTTDDHQRIVFFNQGAERMFGFQGRELIGQSLERLIPNRYRLNHLEKMLEFGRTGLALGEWGNVRKCSVFVKTAPSFPPRRRSPRSS